MTSTLSVLVGIDDDMLESDRISLPQDEKFPHVNVVTDRMVLTFVVNNAEAARALAFALSAAATRLEKKETES